MNKLIVIVGPTCSGKSDLAVFLAKQFHGEVVSADSRQMYKGLDIGSGKITKKEMQDIPHHLLDVASPKRRFTASQYQKLARKTIQSILRRAKIPILAGGTPFYVYAVIDGYLFPQVKPNPKLRKKLEKKTEEELLEQLRAIDPQRANAIEASNKRRLIRAIEIIWTTGEPIPPLQKTEIPYEICMLGIKRSPEELKSRIALRLAKRLQQGMIAEVKNLREREKISWKRLEELGLEYRFTAQFLQKKISKHEMITLLQKAIEDFARRQMVWFKKDSRIHWISNTEEAHDIVRRFLHNT